MWRQDETPPAGAQKQMTAMSKFPSTLPTIPESPPVADRSRVAQSPSNEQVMCEPQVVPLRSNRRPPRSRIPKVTLDVTQHMQMAEEVVHAIRQEKMTGPEKTLEFIRELGERKRAALARRQARWQEEHATEKARIAAMQTEIFEEIEHQQFQRVSEYEHAYDSLAHKYEELLHVMQTKDAMIQQLQSPSPVHPARDEPEADPGDALNDAISEIALSGAELEGKDISGYFHSERVWAQACWSCVVAQVPWVRENCDLILWGVLGLSLLYACAGICACMWTSVELADEQQIRLLIAHYSRQTSTV
ncbi:hypothetical protein ACHHYP_07960 [Achlya hypogyna]|uniref:Uncharacterized protein n=1 Tax=Achlya hypogyna TaxID=1202772 RepID=A0A1V9YQ72_ACHHY|nr:hypothetical protein ACHHYP_07960 [Achlya hypogyna]